MPSSRTVHAFVYTALVSALVATLLGTGAVALPGKDSVDSKDIKDGAVQSKDLKNDGATGKDVKESSLGTVPRSDTVDGLHAARFAYRTPAFYLSGAPAPRTVLRLGGLTVTARCFFDFEVSRYETYFTATTASAGAAISTAVVGGSGTQQLEDQDFNPGEQFELNPIGPGGASVVYATAQGVVSSLNLASIYVSGAGCRASGTALGG